MNNVVRLRSKEGRPYSYDANASIPPSSASIPTIPLDSNAFAGGLLAGVALAAFVVLIISLAGCGAISVAQKGAMTLSAGDCQKQGDGIIDAARTCEEAVDGLNRLVDNSPECKVSYKKRDTAKTCSDVGVQPGSTPQPGGSK